MAWANLKTVEKNIRRLTREIEAIDDYLYNYHKETDRRLYSWTLDRKRDDVVRAAVLQLHTSVEDLLTDLVLYCVLGITEETLKYRLRGAKAKAIRMMLYGAGSLGFDMKLNFAFGLGLISKSMRTKLMELNTIRNKCSHNWLLKQVIRRGRRPKQLKPPLLQFRGRDLHQVAVLKDFLSEFTRIYLRIYATRVK